MTRHAGGRSNIHVAIRTRVVGGCDSERGHAWNEETRSLTCASTEKQAGKSTLNEFAGRSSGWLKYVNHDALIMGIDRFGASAPCEQIAELNEVAIAPGANHFGPHR